MTEPQTIDSGPAKQGAESPHGEEILRMTEPQTIDSGPAKQGAESPHGEEILRMTEPRTMHPRSRDGEKTRWISGLVLGLAIAGLVLSCSSSVRNTEPLWAKRMVKMQMINGLWLQIRDFRSDLRMDLDPSPTTEHSYRNKTVKQTRNVCPDVQAIAQTCSDSCILADHICDNAETICTIADELGQDDAQAQEKCTSAKASCREAKQRCCNCNANPPQGTP